MPSPGTAPRSRRAFSRARIGYQRPGPDAGNLRGEHDDGDVDELLPGPGLSRPCPCRPWSSSAARPARARRPRPRPRRRPGLPGDLPRRDQGGDGTGGRRAGPRRRPAHPDDVLRRAAPPARRGRDRGGRGGVPGPALAAGAGDAARPRRHPDHPMPRRRRRRAGPGRPPARRRPPSGGGPRRRPLPARTGRRDGRLRLDARCPRRPSTWTPATATTLPCTGSWRSWKVVGEDADEFEAPAPSKRRRIHATRETHHAEDHRRPVHLARRRHRRARRWHFPYFNDEMGAAVSATLGDADTSCSAARRTTASPAPGRSGRRRAARTPFREGARRHPQDRRVEPAPRVHLAQLRAACRAT